jgi:hypothetical protein
MRRPFFLVLCFALTTCQCNSVGTACKKTSDCSEGQTCLPIGQCAPTCTGATCLTGEKCSTAGGCIPAGSCGADGDCAMGLICNAQATCAPKCTPTSCGKGTCGTDGRCIGGTGGSGGNGGGSGGSGGSGGNGGGSMVPCPPGLQCDAPCMGSGVTTTISGKVYDPAKKNALYNVAVFVPGGALTPLPKGVPTGSDACSCKALYPSGVVVSATTAEDGTFTLSNAPVGTSVPLVIQIGKWRKLYHVPVTACVDNPQADKSLAFPGTVAAGNTDDNMPDIAVSTGSADTLECLMFRMGLPQSEYVAGPGGTGHVHVFSGGQPPNTMNGIGESENPPMTGAPASTTGLWSSMTQLMPYDILLLSCEGGETLNAKPDVLESYLNAGGRAFASHFHYAWFSGPLDTMQSYAAPLDWGINLALWAGGGGSQNGPIGGIVVTTLNGTTNSFPKGVSLGKWLRNVNALGQNGVPTNELSIYDPRYNATVTPLQNKSQPWILSDGSGMSGATMYFSFDTPVNAPAAPDGGPPAYCGRAVFSDLHVGAGGSAAMDTNPPPTGCADRDLSPQEKALEFMLFDLSSCVTSDTVPPVQIQ